MAVQDSAPVSVFGLTDARLRPIVEAAVGEGVAAFDISVEHQVSAEYYGFAADKLIPTFSYVTPAGRGGRVTVFAKHSHNPDSAEPEHYRFLGQHDVPLPRQYGVLRSPRDRPVLFLEYLDMGELSRGAFTPNVRLEFLSLMARFNAVRPSPEYAAWLGQRLPREREEDTSLGRDRGHGLGARGRGRTGGGVAAVLLRGHGAAGAAARARRTGHGPGG